MKKFTYLVALFMFFAAGLSFAHATEVLFVVANDTNLIAGDKTLSDHLTGRGFTVILKQQNKLEASDVQGHDLVVISNSVSLASVGTILKPLNIPIVCAEPTLFDNLGMTGKTAGTDYGTSGPLQGMVAVKSDITQLSGAVTVSTTPKPLAWGVVNRNGIVGAHLAANASKATLFAYKTGVIMPGLTKAPNKRVGIFLAPNMPVSLTGDGWTLFDNGVDFALLSEPADGCAAGERAIKLASTCDMDI